LIPEITILIAYFEVLPSELAKIISTLYDPMFSSVVFV